MRNSFLGSRYVHNPDMTVDSGSEVSNSSEFVHC